MYNLKTNDFYFVGFGAAQNALGIDGSTGCFLKSSS